MLDSPAAEPTAAAVAPALDPLAAIEAQMLAGQFDAARSRLAALALTRSEDSQIQFLLALLDIHDQKNADAIRRLRRLLVREPGAVRVRLELGRALFAAGNYSAAERQFRLARSGNLPPAVRRNVDRYLGAIRQRKRISVNLALAIAPDTNINAGPAAEAVTIFGLPFQLSQDARASSGVGVSVDAGVEWAPPVAPRTSLRLGLQGHRTQYRQAQFSDATLAAYAGPRLVRQRWTLDLTGSLAQRWFGRQVYSRSYGGALAASWSADQQTEVSGSVGLYSVAYPNLPAQDGRQVLATIGAARALSPRSVVRATVVLDWQSAQIAALANHRQTLGLEWNREFAGGITLALAPAIGRTGYEAPLAAFGTRRIDWQYNGQVRVLSRRIDIRGFTPRLSYLFTRNASTVPLYRYTRNRFELAVVRDF